MDSSQITPDIFRRARVVSVTSYPAIPADIYGVVVAELSVDAAAFLATCTYDAGSDEWSAPGDWVFGTAVSVTAAITEYLPVPIPGSGCSTAEVAMDGVLTEGTVTVELPPDVYLPSGVREAGEGEMIHVQKSAHRQGGHGRWRVVTGSKEGKSPSVEKYTIGDVENDVPLISEVEEELVGVLCAIKVTGPNLSGDTFDFMLNGSAEETVTAGAGWVDCSVPLALDDEIVMVVNTLNGGTGAALCKMRIR